MARDPNLHYTPLAMVLTSERFSQESMPRNGRITISDIARLAGVSKATVSMALRGMPEISVKTRKRIGEMAKELGYRADPSLSKIAASRWKNRKAQQGSSLALVVASDSVARDAGKIEIGARRRADELGYNFEIHRASSRQQFRALVRSLYNRGVEGVALLVTGSEGYLDDFSWQRFSSVVLASSRATDGVSRIEADVRSEVVTAVNAIVSGNCKRVGLVLSGEESEKENDFVRKGLFQGLMQMHFGAESRSPVFHATDDMLSEVQDWQENHSLDAVIGFDDSVYDHVAALQSAFLSLSTDGRCGEIAGISDVKSQVGWMGVDRLDQLVRRGIKGKHADPTGYCVSGKWICGKSFNIRSTECLTD